MNISLQEQHHLPLEECAVLLGTTIESLHSTYLRAQRECADACPSAFTDFVFIHTAQSIRAFVYRYPWLAFRMLTLLPASSLDAPASPSPNPESGDAPQITASVSALPLVQQRISSSRFTTLAPHLGIVPPLISAQTLFNILARAPVPNTTVISSTPLAAYDTTSLAERGAKGVIRRAQRLVGAGVLEGLLDSVAAAAEDRLDLMEARKEKGLFSNAGARMLQRLVRGSSDTPAAAPAPAKAKEESVPAEGISWHVFAAYVWARGRAEASLRQQVAGEAERVAIATPAPTDIAPSATPAVAPSASAQAETETRPTEPVTLPYAASGVAGGQPTAPVAAGNGASPMEGDWQVLPETDCGSDVPLLDDGVIRLPFTLDAEYPRATISTEAPVHARGPSPLLWACSAVDHEPLAPSIGHLQLSADKLRFSSLLTSTTVPLTSLVAVSLEQPHGVSSLLSQKPRIRVIYAAEPEAHAHNVLAPTSSDAARTAALAPLARLPHCPHQSLLLDIPSSTTSPASPALVALAIALFTAAHRLCAAAAATPRAITDAVATARALEALSAGRVDVVPTGFAPPLTSDAAIPALAPLRTAAAARLLAALLSTLTTLRALAAVAPAQAALSLAEQVSQPSSGPLGPIAWPFPLLPLAAEAVLAKLVPMYAGEPPVPHPLLPYPVPSLSMSMAPRVCPWEVVGALGRTFPSALGQQPWTWGGADGAALGAVLARATQPEVSEREPTLAAFAGDVGALRELLRPLGIAADVWGTIKNWDRPVFSGCLWLFLVHVALTDRLCYLPALLLALLGALMLAQRANPWFLELDVAPWTDPPLPAIIHPDQLGPHQRRRWIHLRVRGRDYFGRPLASADRDVHPFQVAEARRLRAKIGEETTDTSEREEDISVRTASAQEGTVSAPAVLSTFELMRLRQRRSQNATDTDAANSTVSSAPPSPPSPSAPYIKGSISPPLSLPAPAHASALIKTHKLSMVERMKIMLISISELKNTATSVRDGARVVGRVISSIKSTLGAANGLLRWHNPDVSAKLTFVLFAAAMILCIVPFKFVFIAALTDLMTEKWQKSDGFLVQLVKDVQVATIDAYQFVNDADENKAFATDTMVNNKRSK